MFSRVVFGNILVIGLLGMMAACASTVTSNEDDSSFDSAEAVFRALVDEGLTCEMRAVIDGMESDEVSVLSDMVAANMSESEFSAILANGEEGCAPDSDVGVIVLGLAGYNDGHSVEWIEDNTIGGSSVQTTGWQIDSVGICGADHNDGIWEVNNLLGFKNLTQRVC